MELDFDTCYRALQSRDPRFDGRFFTTVKTTGIYCRPICPAPLPKPKNIAFVPTAAAAEARGFRACLRCRPEFAAGSPEWNGSATLLQRALNRIYAGALNEGSVEDLASGVTLSARHLTRLFRDKLGATPLEVAQSRRAHDARLLLEGTSMKMCDIAFAAGFGSVRSFNQEIRARFGRTPGELRQSLSSAYAPLDDEISMRLAYRPPLSWRTSLAYLATRAIRGVERVDGERYLRTVEIDGAPGWIEVAPGQDANTLRLRTNLTPTREFFAAIERVRALFDLRCDPLRIAQDLAQDERLRPVIARHPGLRVLGCWDGFELAVRAVLGQQVSLAGACTLLARLVERFGTPIESSIEGLTHCFPSAATVAGANLDGLGMPRARVVALQAIARAVADGTLDLNAGADPELAREALLSLPGIGEWTAEYVLMRALRDPDAFPAGDLVLRKVLADGGEVPSPRAVRELSNAWRPWRAYAAMWLWKSTADKHTQNHGTANSSDDEALPRPAKPRRRAPTARR